MPRRAHSAAHVLCHTSRCQLRGPARRRCTALGLLYARYLLWSRLLGACPLPRSAYMCRRQGPARSKRRTPIAANAAEHGRPWRCSGCAHCWRAAQAPSLASRFNASCHRLPPLLSRSMQLGYTGRVFPVLSAVWGPMRPAGCGHRTLPTALSAAASAALNAGRRRGHRR